MDLTGVCRCVSTQWYEGVLLLSTAMKNLYFYCSMKPSVLPRRESGLLVKGLACLAVNQQINSHCHCSLLLIDYDAAERKL